MICYIQGYCYNIVTKLVHEHDQHGTMYRQVILTTYTNEHLFTTAILEWLYKVHHISRNSLYLELKVSGGMKKEVLVIN